MPDDQRDLRAAELAASIVAARVSTLTARPGAPEGRETALYFRELLTEARRSLGLPPIPSDEEA